MTGFKVRRSLVLLACFFPVLALRAQQPDQLSQPLVETGQVIVDGHSVPYRIRRLPASSFPELPAKVAGVLTERECMVPQTYEAHRPENVVHASLERAGSSDWAVLCSARGTVMLLVFFGSNPGTPAELGRAKETKRLQRHDSSGVLGFNWGIDPATAETVHEAQMGTEHKAPRMDHDALADSVVDGRTVYHVYAENAWIVVDATD